MKSLQELELQKNRFADSLVAMHLQWFAAEDEGRTEDPTEHKIRKAREEGRVAKSSDLASSVVLLFTVIALAALAPWFFTACADMVRFWLQQSTTMDITTDSTIVYAFMNQFTKLVLPFSAVAFIAAIVGNVIQTGFMFTTKPLKPDFKKIVPNLAQYFKRTLGSIEALYNLAKSFMKIGIVIAIAAANIIASFGKLLSLSKQTYLVGFATFMEIAFRIVIESTVVFLVLALFDYWFQRRQHIEALKMTPQEIKQERKEYDGDPLIKSRMRQRMRQILSQNLAASVPKADVVVTNPTHFAIALEYKMGKMHAPEVLAKGADQIAFKIREIAKEYNIPIVENKPLARALYAEVDVGAAIPPKFYEAVVVVMKQVLRMKRKPKEALSHV